MAWREWRREYKREYVEIGGRKFPLGTFSKLMMYATLKCVLDYARRTGKIPEEPPEPFESEDWEGSYRSNPEDTVKKATQTLLCASIYDPSVFLKRLREAGVWGLWSEELSLWFRDALEDLLDSYRLTRDYVQALRRFFEVEKREKVHPIEIAIKAMPEVEELGRPIKRFTELREEMERYEKIHRKALDIFWGLKIPEDTFGQIVAFQNLIQRIVEMLRGEGIQPSLENVQLALWFIWRARFSLPEPFATLLRKTARNIRNLSEVMRQLRE